MERKRGQRDYSKRNRAELTENPRFAEAGEGIEGFEWIIFGLQIFSLDEFHVSSRSRRNNTTFLLLVIHPKHLI